MLPSLNSEVRAFAKQKCPPILKRIDEVQEKIKLGQASPFEIASAKKWIEGCVRQYESSLSVQVSDQALPPTPSPADHPALVDEGFEVVLIDGRENQANNPFRDRRSQLTLEAEGVRLILAFKKGWISEYAFRMQSKSLSAIMNAGGKITHKTEYEVYGYGSES